MEDGVAVVDFCDYKERSQLKDYYKLFKKASGHLVLEYKEELSGISVTTDNSADSVRIAWSAERGCHASSKPEDAGSLADIAFKMLCYRYRNYAPYAPLLGEGIARELERKPAQAGEPPEPLDDESILGDIQGLRGLKDAQGVKG